MQINKILTPSPQTWYHICMSLSIIGLFPVFNVFYNFMPIWLVIPNTFFSIFGILQVTRYLIILGVRE